MSAQAELVSVVIVCYNYGRFLADAVDSVRNQTYRPVEIIIVDGGSSDEETLAMVEALSSDPLLKVYRRSQRCLVGDNRNFGISKANGRLILCLDADDLIRPSFIEKAVLKLRLCGVDIVSASRIEFGERSSFRMLKSEPSLEDLLTENQLNSSSLFKKGLWEFVGGYEDFGLGEEHFYEDWHFWMKCLTAGATVKNLQYDGLIRYRVHGSGSLSTQKGTVPDLESQRSFITSKHVEFKQTLRKRVGAFDPVFPEGAIGTRFDPARESLLVVVPDMSSLRMRSWIVEVCQRTADKDIVLCSTQGFLDREDRLGIVFDAMSPKHYERTRSFPEMDPERFVQYLVESHHVSRILCVNDALAPSDIVALENRMQISVVYEHVSARDAAVSLDVPTVTLRNQGQGSEQSEGSEIWLLGIRDSDGVAIDPEELTVASSGWQWIESEASFMGRALLSTADAELVLRLERDLEFHFLAHPWSGRVEMQGGHLPESLDLYSNSSKIVRTKTNI